MKFGKGSWGAAMAALMVVVCGCSGGGGGNPADKLIKVGALSGATTEAGGQASFTIVLNARPSADVTLSFSSSDSGEGTIAGGSLIFTAEDWDAPKTVLVTGVDDDLADGAQTFAVTFSATASEDAAYAALTPSNVPVVNVDDETAGVSRSPVAGTLTEDGGTAVFGVALTSQPTADVTVSIASNDLAEVTTFPPSLTFTSVNWNAPQNVTLAGVDDSLADGGREVEISLAATSADLGYDALPIAPLIVTNVDDDTAGILVGAVSGPTTENGGVATFTVRLTSEPTADVSFTVMSSDSSEASVSPSSLTFTSADYATPRTVTVTGANDLMADGDQLFAINFGNITSNDATYDAMSLTSVPLANLDDDIAGILVSAPSGPTTEAAGNAQISIVLRSQPTASVTVSFSSSDMTEATPGSTSMLFTTANWNIAQTVTLTGADDLLLDGNQPYVLQFGATSSADASYAAITPANVPLANVDDDIPQKVLVVHSASTALVNDVTAKLTAMGAFQSITAFNAAAATPALADLGDYDAVLLFGASAWLDSAGLGNVIADWFDAGGRVVSAVSSPIGGRFGDPANGYVFLDPGIATVTASGSLGTSNPSNFLTRDVTALSQTGAGRHPGPMINGGTVVASWSDGAPLAITGTKNGRLMAALNVFPASNDAQSGAWTGSGAQLLRNALLYEGQGGGGGGTPTTVTVDAIDRGWWNASGNHTSSNKNTFTGRCTSCSGTLFNSFYVFDLSGVTGVVTAAELQMEIENYYGPDASETASVWDVSTPIATLRASGSGNVGVYDDLASGTPFGSFTVMPSQDGSVVSTNLNAQAATALDAASGFFAIGVHIDTIAGASEEGLRFSNSTETRVHRLVLTVLQ